LLSIVSNEMCKPLMLLHISELFLNLYVLCFVNAALELHMCWNILDGCCLCQSVNQMLHAVIS